ncbi:MAG: VCBS repeat-containing protein [Deltaproteobacteria bacterium]|nr:VCBS repeat-containing protein [Deltaproteobacteria bacterium]
MLRRSFPLCVALAACSPNLGLDKTQTFLIECQSSVDCPKGFECQATGRCVRPGENEPPSLSFGTIARGTTSVNVPVAIFDREGDDVALVVEADLGAGFVEVAVDVPQLSSAPSGEAHAFTWSTAVDLAVPPYQGGVRLRVTPRDALGVGHAVTSDPFAIGNDPPAIAALAFDDAVLKGIAVARFVVADSSFDPVRITKVELSLSGDFTDAVLVPNEIGAGKAFPAGSLSDLATSNSGEAATLTWDSRLSAPIDLEAGACLRVTIADAYGGQAVATSKPFGLDNATSPPHIAVTLPLDQSTPGNVGIDYTLSDLDHDLCLVTVEYSLDNVNWLNAASSSQVSGLGEGPHRFDWQATQLGFATYMPRLRLRVRDASDAGNEVALDPFTVNNTAAGGNAPPGIEMSVLQGAGRALTNLSLAYTASDPEAGPLSVTVEYSTDYDPMVPGGEHWTAATPDAGSPATTGVPSGAMRTFIWDARANLATAVATTGPTGATGLVLAPQTNVYVRARASDGGNPVLSSVNAISSANVVGNAAPSIMMTPISGVLQGDIPITFSIADPLTFDLADVELEFRYDGDVFGTGQWRPAKIALGATTALATGGTPHLVLWDSAALPDLADPTSQNQGIGPRELSGVQLRMRGRDHPVPGVDHYGAWTTLTIAIPIKNQTPPRAELVYLKNDVDFSSGAIPIVYRLIDQESDRVDVAIELSIDNGQAWHRCAEYPDPRSEGSLRLAASPAGVEHTFIWDSTANLFDKRNGVRLRLRTKDAGSSVNPPLLVSASSTVGPTLTARPFTSLPLTTGGGMGSRVIAGSFDAGATLDLLASYAGSGTLVVYTNAPLGDGSGSGSFTAGAAFAPGAVVSAIYGVDLDDDKDTDVVIVDEATMNLVVRRCNGDGTFLAAQTSAVPTGGPPAMPVGVSSADFNGDGKIDLAIAHGSAGVSLLLGDGGGSFSPVAGSPFSAGGSVSSVVAGDFDLDGVMDVAATVSATENIALLYGNADGVGGWNGTFTLGAEKTNLSGPHSLIAGDVDLDGRLDLVIVAHSADTIVFLTGAPGRSFNHAAAVASGSVQPSAILLGDFSGDGLPDVAALHSVGAAVTILVQQTTFDFVPTQIIQVCNAQPSSLAGGHFDANGARDLAVGFTATCAPFPALKVDLLFSSTSDDLQGVPFAPRADFPAGAPLIRAAAADFDQDGAVDVVATAVDSVKTFIGTRSGSVPDGGMSLRSSASVPGLSGEPAIADFDEDGVLDVVVIQEQAASHELRLLRGRNQNGIGTGSFVADATSFALPFAINAVVAGRLNPDAHGDLVAVTQQDVNANAGTVSILLGDGAGGFSVTNIATAYAGLSAAVGDMDDDGDADIVIGLDDGLAPGYALRQFMNDGAGGFSQGTLGTLILMQTPHSLLLADVNSNGDLEAITGELISQRPFHFVHAALFGQPAQVAIADVNGDGGLDFFGANGPLDGIAALLTGGAPFGAAGFRSIAANESINDVVAADINADGMPDLITAHDTAKRLSAFTSRRENHRYVWSDLGVKTAGARTFGPSLPAMSDRFGVPVRDVLGVRRWHGAHDGVGDDPRTLDDPQFATLVRRSGLPGVANAGLIPVTHAWVVSGDVGFARELDATGTRVAVTPRLGPLLGDGTRGGLDVDGPFATQHGVIVDLPIPARWLPTDLEPADGSLRVFVRYAEWVRADAISGDPLFSSAPIPGVAPFLPRVLGADSNYRDVVRAHHVWDEIDPGSVGAGTGPRFELQVSNRRVRVVLEKLGVMQAFLDPP